MKKLITLGLAAVMLICMMVISVSAAPQTVYVYDDFEDESYSETVWIWEGAKFQIAEEGGYIQGDKAAVVMQGMFDLDDDPAITGGTTAPNGVSTEVDFRIDYAYKEDSWIGLWYQIVEERSNDAGEKIQEQVVASVTLNPTTGDIDIYVGPGMAPQGSEDKNDVGAYKLASANVGAIGVGTDVDWNKLGMTVSATGAITAYYNHEAVATAQVPNCPASFQSIVVLWNNQCAVSFDNFLSASPDWDLTRTYVPDTGNDDTSDAADDTSAPAGEDTQAPTGDDTQTPTGDDTQAPAGNDTQTPADDGNTDSAENNTTAAQNNTNKPTNPQTGDATVWFVIAAVAALGLAIVVKKIAAK